MASDYYVDGQHLITFFCGPNGSQFVQICGSNNEFASIPLELFYHMLKDRDIHFETIRRYNNWSKHATNY
jgi:hypothetical protein